MSLVFRKLAIMLLLTGASPDLFATSAYPEQRGAVRQKAVAAVSDGQVAWTKIAFCNAGEVCVTLASDHGKGLDQLVITVKGHLINHLPRPGNRAFFPWLQGTRVISVARADGDFEDRLEVPFLDASMHKFVYRVSFFHGAVYKSEIVADAQAPI